MIDNLQGKLTVKWRWVEGHQDSEGNIQADELAKRGISAEKEFWQEKAYQWYMGNSSEYIELQEELSSSFSPQISSNVDMKMTIHPEHICKSCKTPCEESDHAIQCQECKYWVHYRCSDLPEYQLYLYESTQRRYTCKFCVDIDEDFVINYSDKRVSSTQEKGRESHNTPTEVITVSPKVTKVDKSTEMTDEIKDRKKEQKQQRSVSCQTEESLQLINLQELKKSTMSILQDSFVGAFDKINNSVRDLKNDLAEDSNQKQKIMNLSRENEKLRAGNREKQTDKKCQNCDDLSGKIDKLNRTIDKEKEKSQTSLHTLTVEKEHQEYKLKADITLLKHRIEGLTKQMSIEESEVSALEQRLEIKNNLILDLEEKTSNLTRRISKLQEELLSYKVDNCKSDEIWNTSAFSSMEKDSSSREKDLQEIRLEGDETSTKGPLYSEVVKETTQEANRNKEKIKSSGDNKNDPERYEPYKSSGKKSVRIVGTSNIKYISPAYLGGAEFSISKVTRYTLEETQEYFRNLNPDEKQDIYILQSLCNGLKTKTPEACSDGIAEIVDLIASKFKDSKIIVSLGLPRPDVSTNTKIEKTNILIKERFAGLDHVFLCDNGNLFYRGEAQRGILNDDGIHLSRTGTNKLARNLKGALFDIYDIPWVLYETKRDTKNRGHTDTQYSGGQRRKYSHTNGRTNEWDDGTDKYNTRERYNYINRDDIRYQQNETGRNYYSYDELRDTRMHHNDWEDDNYQRQPNYHYRSNYYQRRHY